MKTLGLIGGMSWESTALYYRYLNEIARERLGGLHSAQLLLWSFDFAVIEECQAKGDWAEATRLMVKAAQDLERGGAEALVICTNTMHKMAAEVQDSVTIPLIHIADATAAAVQAQGLQRPALLATRYTMEQDFYKGRLQHSHSIDVVVPDDAGRTIVHDIIYNELCVGIIRSESKAAYQAVIDKLVAEGADSVILGCTEIGMLVKPDDVAVPVLDTTRIHCEVAMDFALGASNND
jgi:aspartate racemase